MVVETVFTSMLSLILEAIPMEFIFDNVNNFFDIALKLVGAFAVIASMTPNETDNKIADQALKLINLLGFNFGNAKNG